MSAAIEDAVVVPDKRNGGCGVIYDDKLYVWGGQSADILPPDPEMGLDKPMKVIVNMPRSNDPDHPFDVLDLKSMTWSRQTTSARNPPASKEKEEDEDDSDDDDSEDDEESEIPDLGLGSSIVLDPVAECFLLISGMNDLKFSNDVYRIFPGEWKWDIIQPSTDVKPAPRYLTGVIVHRNRLYVFGGVSLDIVPSADCDATYVPSTDSDGHPNEYGWNNEYFEMDLETSDHYIKSCMFTVLLLLGLHHALIFCDWIWENP